MILQNGLCLLAEGPAHKPALAHFHAAVFVHLSFEYPICTRLPGRMDLYP